MAMASSIGSVHWVYTDACMPRAKFPRWGIKFSGAFSKGCNCKRLSPISFKCWCSKALYTERLLARQLKWLVALGDCPAPVEPVVAFICTSVCSKPA